MPLRIRIYTLSVIVAGIGLLLNSLLGGVVVPVRGAIFFLLLGLVTELLKVSVKEDAAISITFTIGIATVLIFKSYQVVSIIAFTTMLFSVEKVNGKLFHILNGSFYKRLFNSSAYVISMAITAIAYSYGDTMVTGIRILRFSIPGIVLSILTYTIVNTTLFMILMGLLEDKSFFELLFNNKWAIGNIIGLSPLAVITAAAYVYYGWFAVVLFFGPLLLARYSFKLYIDMRHVYLETIKALSNAMEAKDEYTKGHSDRVAEYAVCIAKEMRLNYNQIDKINKAAILHDVGKIGVTDVILNKPGKLISREFAEIQKHPEIGARILSEVASLKDVADIIMYHHERFDGKGYPAKLDGDDIPLEACILAVADAYDAMTSNRPYRKAMNSHEALAVIEKESGRQFHPQVVTSFIAFVQNREGLAHAH